MGLIGGILGFLTIDYRTDCHIPKCKLFYGYEGCKLLN